MMPRGQWSWLLIVAGLVCQVGCNNAANSSEKQRPPSIREHPAVPVTIDRVRIRPIQRTVPVVGTFYGYEEVAISSKIDGRILKIYHDLGDVVRSGDLLFELDPIDAQLAVQEATESLKIDLAKLGLTEAPQEDVDIEKLPMVQRASVVLERATRAYDRAKSMRAKSAIAPADFEAAESEFRVAAADRLDALTTARALVNAVREKSVKLAIARQRLADTKVIVPMIQNAVKEFVVAGRTASEGEMIRAPNNGPIFKLVIADPLKLKATLPERYSSVVQIGQQVKASVDSYPGISFQGVITRMDPTVDPINRTFKIEARFPNPERKLLPGSFARASILTKTNDRAKTVPLDAIVSFAGIEKIFIVQENQARSIIVRLGMRGSDWVEVDDQVPDDAPVVVTGHSALVDGMAVRIRNTADDVKTH
jgi:RND family efflux transporter MFP subunit